MTTYDDDEQIQSIQEESSVRRPRPFVADKTKLRVINKSNAPLQETDFSVLLELTGNGTKDDKPGVDIVTVLDVSGSMRSDGKLEKLKTAMKFLIKKLGPAHRLSVVTFSRDSKRLCPLRQMTENAQQDIEGLVNGLTPSGNTNIAGGLRLALKVLDERKFPMGRVSAIMLMSDGDQSSQYEDARNVKVDEVPVFTFGFGRGNEYDPKVLNAIAINSDGGTFSIADVENPKSNDLNIAFAECLGGLLTVVVKDLKITITKSKKDIKLNNLSAGNYPQVGDDTSKTITFGYLYIGEKRKILVDLTLPTVAAEAGFKALDIMYSYAYHDGEPFDAPPIGVSVVRTKGAVEPEREEINNEKNLLKSVDSITKATNFADQNKFDLARNELRQAQSSLDSTQLNDFNKMLKSQLEQLLKLMETPEIYKSKGRHYALVILTSHAQQRNASTGGGDLETTSFYATPAMKVLVQQAIYFLDHPDEPIPKVDIIKNDTSTSTEPVTDQQVGIISWFVNNAKEKIKHIASHSQ